MSQTWIKCKNIFLKNLWIYNYFINNRLNRLTESGIFEFWTKESIFRNNKDRNKYDQGDSLLEKYHYKALSFEHFYVMIVLFFALFGTAFVVLIAEISLKKWKNRNKFFKKHYNLKGMIKHFLVNLKNVLVNLINILARLLSDLTRFKNPFVNS